MIFFTPQVVGKDSKVSVSFINFLENIFDLTGLIINMSYTAISPNDFLKCEVVIYNYQAVTSG